MQFNKSMIQHFDNYKCYSLQLCCLLFVIITSCNQPVEKPIFAEVVPVDTLRLMDYWEHKFVKYSIDGTNQSNKLSGYKYDEERGRQWIFRKDSVFITEYPVFLSGTQSYKIKQDSIIFPNIYFFPRRNKVSFSGDTLILEGHSESGTNLITNYFFKSEYSNTELDFLISEKVNWSLFTNQILKNANLKKAQDSVFPYIPKLDLRKSNSKNFYTSRDTLFYKDSLGKHSFKFRDDIMNSLGLFYLNDTISERVLFFKLNN